MAADDDGFPEGWTIRTPAILPLSAFAASVPGTVERLSPLTLPREKPIFLMSVPEETPVTTTSSSLVDDESVTSIEEEVTETVDLL